MNFLYITIATFLITSCASVKDPLISVSDEKARKIITKAMEAHGGLDRWQKIDYLAFNKWYALYGASGNEEVNVYQHHHYTPEKIYMSWNEDEDKIEQSGVGLIYRKYKNGHPYPNASQSSIKNSILASTFVVNLPFNLMDQGARISYEGETTFNGKAVYVIQAAYFPETEQHHTTKDVWWHYFDQESYISQGYKVQHLDHISLVENHSFVAVQGFMLPAKRSSYRVNEASEKLYLRAAYEYSNYKIKL